MNPSQQTQNKPVVVHTTPTPNPTTTPTTSPSPTPNKNNNNNNNKRNGSKGGIKRNKSSHLSPLRVNTPGHPSNNGLGPSTATTPNPYQQGTPSSTPNPYSQPVFYNNQVMMQSPLLPPNGMNMNGMNGLLPPNGMPMNGMMPPPPPLFNTMVDSLENYDLMERSNHLSQPTTPTPQSAPPLNSNGHGNANVPGNGGNGAGMNPYSPMPPPPSTPMSPYPGNGYMAMNSMVGLPMNAMNMPMPPPNRPDLFNGMPPPPNMNVAPNGFDPMMTPPPYKNGPMSAGPNPPNFHDMEDPNKKGNNNVSGNKNENGSNSNGSSTQNKKANLYKTELCRSFEETGHCRYGSKCQFAHSENELRRVDRHPKYKTEMCKTFWEQGTCPYGKRCCFIHTTRDILEKERAEQQQQQQQRKNSLLHTNPTFGDLRPDKIHTTATTIITKENHTLLPATGTVTPKDPKSSFTPKTTPNANINNKVSNDSTLIVQTNGQTTMSKNSSTTSDLTAATTYQDEQEKEEKLTAYPTPTASPKPEEEKTEGTEVKETTEVKKDEGEKNEESPREEEVKKEQPTSGDNETPIKQDLKENKKKEEPSKGTPENLKIITPATTPSSMPINKKGTEPRTPFSTSYDRSNGMGLLSRTPNQSFNNNNNFFYPSSAAMRRKMSSPAQYNNFSHDHLEPGLNVHAMSFQLNSPLDQNLNSRALSYQPNSLFEQEYFNLPMMNEDSSNSKGLNHHPAIMSNSVPANDYFDEIRMMNNKFNQLHIQTQQQKIPAKMNTTNTNGNGFMANSMGPMSAPPIQQNPQSLFLKGALSPSTSVTDDNLFMKQNIDKNLTSTPTSSFLKLNLDQQSLSNSSSLKLNLDSSLGGGVNTDPSTSSSQSILARALMKSSGTSATPNLNNSTHNRKLSENSSLFQNGRLPSSTSSIDDLFSPSSLKGDFEFGNNNTNHRSPFTPTNNNFELGTNNQHHLSPFTPTINHDFEFGTTPTPSTTNHHPSSSSMASSFNNAGANNDFSSYFSRMVNSSASSNPPSSTLVGSLDALKSPGGHFFMPSSFTAAGKTNKSRSESFDYGRMGQANSASNNTTTNANSGNYLFTSNLFNHPHDMVNKGRSESVDFGKINSINTPGGINGVGSMPTLSILQSIKESMGENDSSTQATTPSNSVNSNTFLPTTYTTLKDNSDFDGMGSNGNGNGGVGVGGGLRRKSFPDSSLMTNRLPTVPENLDHDIFDDDLIVPFGGGMMNEGNDTNHGSMGLGATSTSGRKLSFSSKDRFDLDNGLLSNSTTNNNGLENPLSSPINFSGMGNTMNSSFFSQLSSPTNPSNLGTSFESAHPFLRMNRFNTLISPKNNINSPSSTPSPIPSSTLTHPSSTSSSITNTTTSNLSTSETFKNDLHSTFPTLSSTNYYSFDKKKFTEMSGNSTITTNNTNTNNNNNTTPNKVVNGMELGHGKDEYFHNVNNYLNL